MAMFISCCCCCWSCCFWSSVAWDCWCWRNSSLLNSNFLPRQSCFSACSFPFLEWLAPTVLFRFCSFAFFECCVLYIICTLWSLCFTDPFLLPFSSSHHSFFAVLLVLSLFLAMHNLVTDIGQGLVYLVLDMYPTCLTLFPLFSSLIVLVQLIKILTDLLVTFTPLSWLPFLVSWFPGESLQWLWGGTMKIDEGNWEFFLLGDINVDLM